jgi:hypothetical protein
LVIEVVVTHAPKVETAAAYQTADLTAFEVRPSWRNVDDWKDGVTASAMIHGRNPLCQRCVASGRADINRREELRDQLARLAARRPAPTFEPWMDSRYGRSLFPRTGRIVHLQATALCYAGFRQSRKKLWLFFAKLPDGVIFADLGGSDVVPIHYDPSALIYVSGFSDPGRVLSVVRRHLHNHKVAWRLSFYDRSTHLDDVLEESTPPTERSSP